MQPDQPLDVGVIGVGTMGQHHARVYEGLPTANLVGVFDTDGDRAADVAANHGATALSLDDLLTAVDATSVAVPTAHHANVATRCLDAGVAPLVEKPLVEDPAGGRRLQAHAKRAGIPVQVGHIERFNPAVTTLQDILADLSVISLNIERLGPPPGREIEDSAVIDLMIHDVDVVLALLDETPRRVKSCGVQENRYATALLEFASGTMASLTASRLTQRKVRRLQVTAEECFVELDYIGQSIEIHRNSVPEYAERNGDIQFRHESIVERPHVPNEEPLHNELAAFVDAVLANEPPEVTIDDGLAALELTQQIEAQALDDRSDVGIEVAHE